MDDTHRWFPDGLPDGLLDLADHELLRALGRPTLIRVPGTGEQAPRAVSTLLHGDESTGYHAVMRVLRRRRRYPFDLYVLIGNVAAALADPTPSTTPSGAGPIPPTTPSGAGPIPPTTPSGAGHGFGHRYLDDQEDFNRIWGFDGPLPPHGDGPAGRPSRRLRHAADAILARLRAAGLESLVDVHNNSGNNPFYAIVTRERPEILNLATLFTTTLLHWDLGAHTLMEALEDECAAIAVECGLPGRPESLAFAVDGLRRYLGHGPLTTAHVTRDFDLLAGLRKVTVRPEVRFRFGGDLSDDTDFVIGPDADLDNFVEVPGGHVIGHIHPGAALPLRACESTGVDVTTDHFAVVDGTVVIRRAATPVMMTRTVEAARKDCLLYLATELPPPGP